MVHPDPGDAVAVSDEVPDTVPDNGSVGAVNAHPAEAGPHHLSHAVRVHQQQGQAVLPEIPPAPASPAIVVVRQEGAAVEPAQKGLEGNPAHEAVKVRAAGGIADIHSFLPIGFCLVQQRLYLPCRPAGVQDAADLPLVLRNAEKDDVLRRLSLRQRDRREPDAAHSLPAMNLGFRGEAGAVFIDRARVEEGAALANEGINGGVKRLWTPAVAGSTQHVVDAVIFPVALLVKGHGGLDQYAVVRCPDAVEHGGHVPVVPDVVRAPSIDGDGRDAGHALGCGVCVGDADMHDLHILTAGDKGRDLRAEPAAF